MLRDEKNNYTGLALKYMDDINKFATEISKKMLEDGFTIEEIGWTLMTECHLVGTHLQVQKTINISKNKQ